MKKLFIFILGLTLVGIFVFGFTANEYGVINFADLFNDFATVVSKVESTIKTAIDFILDLFK